MKDRLLTPTEVAEYLKVPEKTLTHWRYRRCGPRWMKIESGRVRYRESDFEAWLEVQAAVTAVD